LIVAADDADPMVIDAITKALEERKVTPYVKYVYEMKGITMADAAADRERRLGGQDIKEAGIYQATAWITGQFPNPSQPANWLKQKDPKTFTELFPGRSAESVLTATAQKPRGEGGADADTGTTDSAGPGGSGSSGKRGDAKGGDAKSGDAKAGEKKGTDYRSRFAVGDSIKD